MRLRFFLLGCEFPRLDSEVNSGCMNDQEHLSAYLAERDVLCVSCGYCLRGITGGRCPECNEELVLRVGLAEPRFGAVIAVLAGAWCCAGTSFALLAGMLGLSLYFGDWPPVAYWVPGLVGLALSAPVAIGFGTRDGRSWIRKRSGVARILLIAGAWALFVGSFVAFGVVVVTM